MEDEEVTRLPAVPGTTFDPMKGLATSPPGTDYRAARREQAATSKYRPPRPAAPWERQASEGGPAYRAFKVYRDMENRSYRKVARDTGIREHVIGMWSKRWGWVDRVQYWDQEVERREAEGRLRAVELASERHVNLSLMMQQKVAERLRDPKLLSGSLTNKDIPKWLKTAIEIERAALGIQSGPGIQVNVNQQQTQGQQQAAAASAGERTIAELLERNPELLGQVLPEIDGILDHVGTTE